MTRVEEKLVHEQDEALGVRRVHLVATGVAWLLALLIVLAAARAARAEMDLQDSHVAVTGIGVFVDHDDDQFRQRHGLPPGFTGGLEDLHMAWTWGDGGTVELDGRGLFDNNDYLAKLRVEKREKGYVSTGYREFRTWYDGTGGFFPGNGLLISYFDEDLALDRGEAWFEAGLRVPNVPNVTARYEHLFRDGTKSSTVWGDTQLTGTTARNIVPSFWNIDERRNIFDIDVMHRISSADVGAGFRYESSDISDSLNARRRPGEAQDRFFTQKNEIDSDVYDTHAFSTMPLAGERLTLSTSYAFASVENDLGGSRIYGAGFNPAFDPTFAGRQPFDEGFLDLDGATQLREHVGTITLQGRPTKQLHVTGGLRAEREDLHGESDFTETTVGVPPLLATAQDPLNVRTETDNTRVTESLDVRYKGVKNWVFYADGEWTQEDADLLERETDVAAGAVALERLTDMDIRRQKYGAGATWYPLKAVNLGARYAYKIHKYDFLHVIDSTLNTSTDRFPAFITDQNVSSHTGDLRITWRLSDTVRATGRYDFALSDFEQRSDGLATVESANVDTHAFGGNLSWSPTGSSYVQGDVNYVISETDTPAAKLFTPPRLVADFDNDYLTASLTAGVALDARTDLRGQYFYFHASNYGDNSAVTQPYGSDAEEHGVSLAVTRQLTDSVRGRIACGFFSNDEELAGAANDYTAGAVTGTMEVSF